MTRRQHTSTFFASLAAAASLALAAPAFAGASATARPPADAASAQMSAAQIMIKADTNHDGRISPEEAAKVADLAGRFQTVDTDHDGFLSAGELYAANHAPKTP